MLKNLGKLVMAFSLMVSASVWADSEGAREKVIQMVDAFRSDIVADRDVLAKDPELLNQRVEKILADIVDFDQLSRNVMGKYYRRATPAQLERFSQETKATLLKTYGTALLELDPDRITVLPLGPQREGRPVKVDVTFQQASGVLLNISFLMEENKAGAWLLDNIIIENINFGLTFRKQFAVMMQQNKNNIDAAIDAWRDSLSK
ncbi:MlaC/ttg2D family ABC transporter substrate-binding protein [Marinomonas dokdonensis]|uniref:MlaC/ttg2D family ABC transporter substrate-binding protein n=1 Tax=Marinomonas dokdonensis TaxID=328224 RepID=UPI004055485E